MQKLPRLIVLLLGCLLLFTRAEAKNGDHGSPRNEADLATPAPDPRSLAPETAPEIDSAAAPSLSLGPFIARHTGKILAPLDDSPFTQTEIIVSIQSSYADGLANAGTARKPAYRAAIAVCVALSDAITHRQNAAVALRGALATRSSEATQPSGGNEAVSRAKNNDAFFLNGQKSNWIAQAGKLQRNIDALYLNVREAERLAGPWPATPNGGQSPDPILGKWKWHGTVWREIRSDHSYGGKWPGTWFATADPAGQRCYEFHANKVNSVDTMTLSDDGSSLTGTSKDGKRITARRAD